VSRPPGTRLPSRAQATPHLTVGPDRAWPAARLDDNRLQAATLAGRGGSVRLTSGNVATVIATDTMAPGTKLGSVVIPGGGVFSRRYAVRVTTAGTPERMLVELGFGGGQGRVTGMTPCVAEFVLPEAVRLRMTNAGINSNDVLADVTRDPRSPQVITMEILDLGPSSDPAVVPTPKPSSPGAPP